MITFRDYQVKAIDRCFEEWKDNQSTLIVCPTGCGKTTIFSEIARRFQPKKVVILVHREELLNQAKARMMEQAGIFCDVEMGSLRAANSFWNKNSSIVATVQTMYSGNGSKGRMANFDPREFALLICDEAHHYVSPAYKRVIDYFRQNPELKVLGVTATPDRTDEEALGQLFESVAHDYEILDAIHDGWLVPVDQQMVEVEGLDFSGMRTQLGDLNSRDLADVMEREEVLQGVAAASIEIIGGKRSIAFTSSVHHAEMLCNIFNRHRSNMATWICGKTAKPLRAQRLHQFKSGDIQVIVNCGVLTEGFDCPEVECIIQARPTKSRSLYAQIIGRSLRPLPGLVDAYGLPETRRKAIADSSKKSSLIIDFVGNAGRHKLMSSADILGGNVSDKAIERAVQIAKDTGKPIRINEVLDSEEEDIKRQEEAERKRVADIALKAKLIGKSVYSTHKIDPFERYSITPKKVNAWDERYPLSEKQIGVLKKEGIEIDTMSMTHKKQLFNKIIKEPSEAQKKLLSRYNYDVSKIGRAEASKLIQKIADNGWKRPVEEIILNK